MDNNIQKTITEETAIKREITSYSKIISAATQIGILLIVLFGGGMFGVGFTLEQFKDPATWILIGLSVPLTAMAAKSAIDIMTGWFLPKREIVVNTKKEYNELVPIIEDDIEIFLGGFNRKRKKQEYEKIVNIQKSKLAIKYSKGKMSEEEYMNNLKIIQERLSIRWLEENIDTVPVKYDVVLSGHFTRIISDDSYDVKLDATLNGNVRKYLSKKTMIKLLLNVVAAGLFFTYGVATYASFTFIIAMQCLWQFISGLLKSADLYDGSVTAQLELKSTILKEYITWKKKNPNEIERIKREAEERVIQKEKEAEERIKEKERQMDEQLRVIEEAVKETLGTE